MSVVVESPEGAILSVKVQPRSSRAGIAGVADGALKVRLHSAPVDGQANRELVETLAEAFGIPKSRVSVKSGGSARTKRILLSGLTAEAAAKCLPPSS